MTPLRYLQVAVFRHRENFAFYFYVVRCYAADLPTLTPTTAPPVDPLRAVTPWRRSPCRLITTITSSITATWATTCRRRSQRIPPATRRTAPPRGRRSRRSTTSTSGPARTTSTLQRPLRPPPATRWPCRSTDTWLTVTSERRPLGTLGTAAWSRWRS